jgi:hypothetical protein
MKFFNNVDVNSNNVIYANTLTASAGISVSSTDPAELYRFSASDYVSAKFIITINSISDESVRELLTVHNNIDGFVTEYAIVSTGLETRDDSFGLAINSGDALLTITPSTVTTRNVNIYVTLIK